MAEYDSRTINCGFEYSFWKDYNNAVVELNRCRLFFRWVGVQGAFEIRIDDNIYCSGKVSVFMDTFLFVSFELLP